jgi:hypothetical protein
MRPKGVNVKPGEAVVLTALPDGLVDGLPKEDQEAISAIVGHPVQLLAYTDDGRAELNYDSQGGVHSIFVSRVHKTSGPAAVVAAGARDHLR